MCALTLATLDSTHNSATNDRERLGVANIIINIIINCVCILMMIWKILQQIRSTYKEYSERKRNRVHKIAEISSLNGEDSRVGMFNRPNEGESFADTSLQSSSLAQKTFQQKRQEIKQRPDESPQYMKNSDDNTKFMTHEDKDMTLQQGTLCPKKDDSQNPSTIKKGPQEHHIQPLTTQ